MNKIAQYLNEHILGEATSSPVICKKFSQDASVLSIKPDIVVSPRVANDIRKVARFSWQLAEKGHVLPITVRGGGSDQTGAAIGKGVIINTKAHLNSILYLSLKDKDHIVHVQPGITFQTLNDVLEWHGLYVPSFPSSAAYSTIGGAVANNSAGQLSGVYGPIGDAVTRLEVVLSNGDLIETGRISKRELNKKKGLQTLEGEIYRQIDGLIEDNQELIEREIASDDIRDNSGYSGIAKVKHRDGSFDLTPLFIGSQGTLGIISEIVLKTEFYSSDQSIVIAAVDNIERARDVADDLRKLQPASLEIFDGELFDMAHARGKKYPVFNTDISAGSIGAVLVVIFNDFGERARARKLKRTFKLFDKLNATVITSDDHSIDELTAIREVTASSYATESAEDSYPPLIGGVFIPADRQEEFANAVHELADKHHITLPLHIRVLDSVIYTRPKLQLRRVGDKQKVFKLISEYFDLVARCDGSVLADSAEGRLKSYAVQRIMDDDVKRLYEQIRLAFDPFNTLNPGVKQPNELKQLAGLLRSDYDTADFADFSLYE